MLTSHALTRWPAIRLSGWLAGVAILGLLATACGRFGGEPDEAIDRLEWAERTGHLLEQAVRVEDGTAILVAPVYEGSDVYAMSQAIVALGGRAGDILEGIKSSGWRERFDSGLAWEQLTGHIVGPIYVAGKAVEADAAAGDLLTDEQERTLARVVDDAVAGTAADDDVFQLLNVREISRATGHRPEDVEQWIGGVAAEIYIGCGEEDLPELGAAGLVGAQVECGDNDVAGLWDDAVARLRDEGEMDGGTCENLFGLARIQHERWPDDPARREALVTAFRQFEALLADARVVDLLPCLGGGIRPTAALLGVELALPAYAVDYATAVVRDGGEPWLVRLDASGLATVLRTARLVDAEVDVPFADLDAPDDAQRIDLLLAGAGPGHGWSTEIVRLAEELSAAVGPRDTLAIRVLMRTLTHGGDQACGSPLVEVADRFVEEVGSAPNPARFPLVSQAMAIRVLQVCDRSVPAVEAAVLGRIEAMISRIGTETNPELLEAADAVAAACALKPASLPDPDDRWDAYRSHAGEHGGGVDMELGVISTSSSYALAVLAMTTAEGCDEDGMPE